MLSAARCPFRILGDSVFDASSRTAKAVDVVMAITVLEDGPGSCMMHTALLGEWDLKPRAIVMQTAGDSGDVTTELTGPPSDTAGNMVAGGLERQIDCQLFYNENWGTKLLRRLERE